MVLGIEKSQVRIYFIRPDIPPNSITESDLNTYSAGKCEYPYDVKYIYANCESIAETEEKKVKITRYANRGCVAIDLREQYHVLTLKNVYLGTRFGGLTEDETCIKVIQAWKYALNEWNKISPGKTFCRLLHVTLNSNGNVEEIKTKNPYSYSYKAGLVETTYIWSKSLSIETETTGHVYIRTVTLEEKL